LRIRRHARLHALLQIGDHRGDDGRGRWGFRLRLPQFIEVDTVISRVSTFCSPAPAQSPVSASKREASMCGGRVGDSPIARISAMIGSSGNPPLSMSHM
jgi:hypothetical protein